MHERPERDRGDSGRILVVHARLLEYAADHLRGLAVATADDPLVEERHQLRELVAVAEDDLHQVLLAAQLVQRPARDQGQLGAQVAERHHVHRRVHRLDLGDVALDPGLKTSSLLAKCL